MRILLCLLTLTSFLYCTKKELGVPYPEGYKNWSLLKSALIAKGEPLFDPFGGIHHIYGNSEAQSAIEAGQPAPDGSVLVFDLYEEQPWQKVAELKGQSTRAAISIASNIAEGNSRRSEKDKHRFMEMALGSAFELETQTLTLQRRNWSPKPQVEVLLAAIDEEQKMIAGFMSKLRS